GRREGCGGAGVVITRSCAWRRRPAAPRQPPAASRQPSSICRTRCLALPCPHPLPRPALSSLTCPRPAHPAAMPPASVLTKTGPPAAEHNGKPVNPRHLDVALHHAAILEQRKAVEAQVLDAILALMDARASPQADPARPAAADARAFEHAVAAFQPADYDALIEERNIAGRCGYALCPRPKKRARSTARKQFVDTARGVEIVDRTALEVWCSDDCARRALYVKVQLNEEPAWLRAAAHGERIELLADNAHELRATLPLRPRQHA
ncbi:DUF408 domain-containing protein (Rtr1/RPAP2 family protein), partial [Stagonosporopsis vannaccii]